MNAPRSSHLHVEPFGSALGAVIHGVDLSQPPDEPTFAVIRQAFADYGVIFFRDQRLTPEQHLAFARRWAPVDVNAFFAAVPGHPEIAEVRKEPDQKTNIGGGWHTDHSYDAEPAMGSLLLAREVPPKGGDTLFANMALAYDALSPGLKRTLQGLRAVHDTAHVFGRQGAIARKGDAEGRIGNADAAIKSAAHPVVIRHPLSGRATLYVNSAFTTHFEGWTAKESEGLLQTLYQHAARPEFACRFEWQEGSLAFWDNRATWHYALNDYHGNRRLMHRITVQGGPLQAFAS